MATNIKTIDNKVVFDGHAQTESECDLITNICDVLNNSDKFITKEYRLGYAEFESVDNSTNKMFAPEPSYMIFVFDANVIKVSCEYGEVTSAGGGTLESTNMWPPTTVTVTCRGGYIIDTVTADEYGSVSNITDFTFVANTTAYTSFNNTFTITTKLNDKYVFERLYEASEISGS